MAVTTVPVTVIYYIVVYDGRARALPPVTADECKRPPPPVLGGGEFTVLSNGVTRTTINRNLISYTLTDLYYYFKLYNRISRIYIYCIIITKWS